MKILKQILGWHIVIFISYKKKSFFPLNFFVIKAQFHLFIHRKSALTFKDLKCFACFLPKWISVKEWERKLIENPLELFHSLMFWYRSYRVRSFTLLHDSEMKPNFIHWKTTLALKDQKVEISWYFLSDSTSFSDI